MDIPLEPPPADSAYHDDPALVRPLWDVADAAAAYLRFENQARLKKNHKARLEAGRAMLELGKALDRLEAITALVRKAKERG